MKKLITVMCLSVLATTSALATWTVDGYTYTYEILSGGGVNIRPIFNTSSHNTASAVTPSPTGNFVIPASLPDGNTNFLPVVNIGYQPRFGRYAGSANAFSSSTMTSVVIPDTVTNIDLAAFADCTSLVSVRFPISLKTIGLAAFANCPQLNGIEFPDGLAGIGDYAFSGCLSINHVVIPEGVEYIGGGAFSGSGFYNSYGLSGNFDPCTNLTSVTIPSSVTNIGYGAFSGCVRLRSANVGGGAIGSSAFSGCISLSEVTLGENVTSIGNSAFQGCMNLTEVVIPDSVTDIGNSAFSGCTNMTRIVLGNGVRSIGNYAFQSCTNLTVIVIPNGVTSIGAYAFSGCSSLTEVVVPDSVKTIGESAFAGCTSLRLATVGNGLRSIGRYAFSRCTSLDTVEIGSGDIGEYMFYNCPELRVLRFGDGVTQIGDYAANNCFALTSVSFGNNITNIGRQAFNQCGSLSSIELPANLKSLGFLSFGSCTNLTRITIPSSMDTIADYAFAHCSGVTELVLPFGLKAIGSNAFAYCTALQDFTIPSTVTNIGENAFGSCMSIRSIEIPDNVQGTLNAFSNCTNLRNVVIGNGITSIGSNGFKDCHSLKEITIPDSVTNIATYAFKYCWSMTNAVVGTNVQYIDTEAFANCYELKNIVLPDNLTQLGYSAFESCGRLTDITVPDGVTSIDGRTFYGCSSMTNATIGAGVASIGRHAFRYCSKLENVTILGAVDSYPDSSYYIYSDTPQSLTTYVTALWTGPTDGWQGRPVAFLTHKIAFDANGGAGTMPDQDIVWFATSNLTANAFVREGYTFAGWTTNTNGVVVYSDGQSIAPSADMALYAVWMPTLGTAVDNAAIGFSTGSTVENDNAARWIGIADQTAIGGDSARSGMVPYGQTTFIDTMVTNRGILSFRYKVSGGTGDSLFVYRVDSDRKSLMAGQTDGTGGEWIQETYCVTNDGAHLARWVYYPYEYTEVDVTNDCAWIDQVMWSPLFTFDGNGGVPATSNINYVAGSAYGILPTVSRAGYSMAGWFTSPDGGAQVFSTDIVPNVGTTLYAHWEENAYVVTVDADSGKTVTVPRSWITGHPALLEAVGGNAEEALRATAANGRMSVVECYVLGLDPESTTNDFKITSFPMKADGTPDLENIVFDPPETKWNVEGARPVVKGAASLGGEWQTVTEENKASFRFFKVEVALP